VAGCVKVAGIPAAAIEGDGKTVGRVDPGLLIGARPQAQF
jgi:hypothetical protein